MYVTGTYEKALHKLELCEKISEVDSDDDVNMEKLKKTRHSRCIKVKEEDDGQETSKNKQKVLGSYAVNCVIIM